MTPKYSYPGAAVFDVDSQTGFMAPSEPLLRLPAQWEPWEATLDAAIHVQLQLGDKPGLTKEEATQSEEWRASVRLVRLLAWLYFLRNIDANRRVAAGY
jgi:indoleamine 2,3-dioxygenase